MPSNPGLSNHARGAAGYGRAARGLVVRGVVTRVYYLDALPAGLLVAGGPPSPSGLAPAALYCDVLVYSGIPGARTGLIPRVLITYDAGGVHDGDVAVPRATRKMVADPTGRAPDEDGGASPAVFDGDHVLVGFMDDSIDQPFVLRYLRHPHADHAKNPMAVPGEKLGLIRAGARPPATLEASWRLLRRRQGRELRPRPTRGAPRRARRRHGCSWGRLRTWWGRGCECSAVGGERREWELYGPASGQRPARLRVPVGA